MNLLRLFTAGNVDDGKSTLIGRLLYDSHSINEDVIETLSNQSSATNSKKINLALLTDGLKAEREQGITIDVAYKYFSTDKRKFIIADTPGHLEYTRNMFTGASNCDLAVILVDAKNGITEQTKRHSIIASILNIPHILICINKMDLLNYEETHFEKLKHDYQFFSKKITNQTISFIPISALVGDNVVLKTDKMPWYKGKTLLNFLETIQVNDNSNDVSRFQAQYIIRSQDEDNKMIRGISGKILSGIYTKGQDVVVLPSKLNTKIASIKIHQKEVQYAKKNDSVIFYLTDNIDLSRGFTIVPSDDLPHIEKEITATICWMDNQDYVAGQKIILQQNSFQTKAIIKKIIHKIDIQNYTELVNNDRIQLNDICRIIIKTSDVLAFDNFEKNKNTGSFILINENTNNTIAAGIIH